MMKLLLVLCTLVAGGTAQNSLELHLKGQPILHNGVVIFHDIGGYLSPADGLICYCMIKPPLFFSTVSPFWSYPNGTHITNFPSLGIFGTSNCTINHGESLYYSGMPKERGKFECTPTFGSSTSISAYIVDMNITGPNLVMPGEIAIAGEDVEFSINVTTFPEDVPIPYQWSVMSVNGTPRPLAHNSTKYRGTQTGILTIFNVKEEDQGSYTCSVANSASGINVDPTKLVVFTLGVTVAPSTNNPETGKNYTLNCTVTGVDVIKDIYPEYHFHFIKNEKPFYDAGSASHYNFKSLKFSDAGTYACQVIATFKRGGTFVTTSGTSKQLVLTFSAIVYRIYLQIKLECHQWTDQKPEIMDQRLEDINGCIKDGINAECSQISETDIIITNDDHAFKCPNNPKSVVVYNAQLHSKGQINTSILVSCLDKWIATQRSITVSDVELEINHDCTEVVNDDNHDYECAASGNQTDKLAIRLGVTFGVLSAVIGIAIFFAIICMGRNKHRHEYSTIDQGARGQDQPHD